MLSFKLALRELRGGLSGLSMFVACLALGVAAITLVGSLSASVERGAALDARRLLGGDLEVSQSYRPVDREALAFLRQRGRVAALLTTRVMARRPGGEAALAELKAVDPAYPLVGRVELAGSQDLARALGRGQGIWGAVCEPALLTRLGLKPGQELILGKRRFQIRGVIQSEPDAASRLFKLGPGLMISLEGLQGSGVLAPGAVVRYVYKVALTEPARAAALAAELKKAYPGRPWRVRDSSGANGRISRVSGNLTMYLTLVSLASLLLGGIGVAGASASYLAGKKGAIATLKCLGADRATVFATYLWQVVAMSLAGCTVGIGGGALAALWLWPGLAQIIGLSAGGALAFKPLLLALAYGLLTALAFSLAPLSSAGRVSPAGLFRGYLEPGGRRPGRAAMAAIVAVWAVLIGLTVLTSVNKLVAFSFAAAVGAGAGLFGLLAWSLVRLAAVAPHPGNPRVRLALANLHRPGNSTASVAFSLGLGLMVLVAVTQVDGQIQNQIKDRLPEKAPSFFLLNIQPNQIGDFRRLAAHMPGVDRVEYEPSLRGRITGIAGKPAEKVKVDPEVSWALRSDRGMTFSGPKPDKVELTAGKWWPPDYAGPPLLSFDDRIAKGFGIGVGDTLTVSVLGREITATIANLRRIDWTSMRLNHAMIFAPGLLEKAPYTHIATVYAGPLAEKRLKAVLARRFPNVVAIYTKDVLEQVAAILGNLSAAVRAAAGVTLLMGLLVLGGALRANLKRRHFEAVVFKVFGATRWDMALSLAAEFTLQGTATALAAAGLGLVASWLFTSQVLRLPWQVLPLPLAVIVAGGVGATLLLGLTGVLGAMGKKAWPLLRND